jgi:HIRAN domain
MEHPTKIELFINRKTVKALAVTTAPDQGIARRFHGHLVRRAILSSSRCPRAMRYVTLAIVALALAIAAVAAPAQGVEVRMLVQSSPLAGFQYYQGGQLWDEIKVGDLLTLAREPANPHDSYAVRVEWRGHKLGYVPRRENQAVAQHMDRGGNVEARVSKLRQHRNPWQRIEFEVFVKL